MARQVRAGAAPDHSIEHHLAPRMKERLGDGLLARAHARPDLRERHGAAVGRNASTLDGANAVADLPPATERLDDDVGVEEDAGYGRRRRSRCVSRRSRFTYPLVSPISVRFRHRPSIARRVPSRSSAPAPYARTRASRTRSEMVRP